MSGAAGRDLEGQFNALLPAAARLPTALLLLVMVVVSYIFLGGPLVPSRQAGYGGALLRPASCRPAVVTEFTTGRNFLPNFYFLAGVEGAGHDFMERFFGYLPANISMVQFEPGLHLVSDDAQVFDGSKPKGVKSCPRLPYARHAHDFGTEITARLHSQGDLRGYLRSRDPFPMGRIRTPLARPDLISLALFDGILYNLKVLVLVRNASLSVGWSVSKGFHNNDIGLQVRLAEDSMVYLDACMRMLPCSTYAAIDVDLAIQTPEVLVHKLKDFLDVPDVSESDVQKALRSAKSVYSAPVLDTLPDFAGTRIEDFFELRRPMWPLLSACRGVPFFSPRHPHHWP